MAAAMIAASALAAPPTVGDLKYSGASAFEKWHLTASAARKSWDPTDALPVSRFSLNDDMRVKPSTFVNARLARNLSKRTRLSVDVFNVFDQRVTDVDYFSAARLWTGPGAADSFLFNPAEPRGFRVKLRTTF